MNDKRILVRRLLILSLIVLLVSLTTVSVTRAWFTSGKDSRLEGIGMDGTDIPFELEVHGGIIENKSLFAKVDASYQDGEDLSLTPTAYRTSGTYDRIIWRKTGDTSEDGHYEQGIGPNSHGRLTFWVVPKADGDLNIAFRLDIRGFLATFDEREEPENLFEITDDMTVTAENGLLDAEDLEKKKMACNYLKGHILFFADYDSSTGYYSGFLGTGNTISFADCIVPGSDPKVNYGVNETVSVEKGQKYQVTIYWKWADTLEQILLDENSPHRDEPLFASGNQVDLNEMYSYLNDPGNSVFQDLTPTEISGYLDSMRNHSEDEDVALSELSVAYNNADLLIGYNMQYIMFELTAVNGLD